MDPALQEMMEGSGGDEVEAIVRLTPGAEPPPGVRLVARFGAEIATIRMTRSGLGRAWADDAVASLKAPRPFGVDPDPLNPLPDEAEAVEERAEEEDERRPAGLRETGRGVIVGVVDWGFDFAHPNFRNPDGSTRALAFWDQSAPGPGPEPYGYGRVFLKEEIDRALAAREPYTALGYHPGSGDPGGRGSHGTHVLDIAAGNGRAGRASQAPSGIAPEADLVFVHLANRGTGGRANLGDSVTLLEALDWIARLAGGRPWVVNLSMGRHGGDHKGRTLVEQALDALVTEAPGRAVVQSTGNYFSAQTHAEGILRPGHERTLRWWTERADRTPNELEIWYPGSDVFDVELRSPEGGPAFRIPLGGQASIEIAGREVGNAYHRAKEPNSGDNHIDVFLYPEAPAGRWDVVLTAEDVVDGRYHAWVERDAGCASCQSRLDPEDAVQTTTTGTICNGYRSLVVGAYDARSPEREPAPFSSSGPTRDGRVKPDLLAPGVRILAARSASFEQGEETPPLTRMSGTSMAAPHVAGTVALVFQAAGRPLRIEETRRLLLATAEPAPADWARRAGSGYLDIERAVAAAREEKAMISRETEEETHDAPTVCSCGGHPAAAPREEPEDEETWDEDEPETDEEDEEDDGEWEEDEEDEEDEEEWQAEPAPVPGVDGSPASPAAVFDAFAVPRWPAVRRHFEQYFEVVAFPGEAALGVQDGDLMVRRALGEGGLAQVIPAEPTAGEEPRMLLRLDELVLRPRGGYAWGEDFGEAAKKPSVQVLVNNRFIQEPVPDCQVALSDGAGFTAVGTANRYGKVKLDLTGAPDGEYRMTFTPPANTADPVGPAVGDPASSPPDRIWRVLDAGPVTVRGGKVQSVSISTPDGDLAVSKGVVKAKIQPVWMKSPNQSARPASATIDLCVVHHTGGNKISSALYTFLSTSAETSAHYVLGKDGQAVKMVHESRVSNHAGPSHWAGQDSVNAFSVGIEIVHKSGAYPAEQITAVSGLLQSIRTAHPGIPADRVVGHADVATSKDSPRRLGRKSGDPGANFEWDTLRAAGLGIPVRSATMPAAAFGGLFGTIAGLRLRKGDKDSKRVYGGKKRTGVTTDVIRELQEDLAAIGYFCPVTGTFDTTTYMTVKIFQEHFFSGALPRAANPGKVDEATAERIKQVRPRGAGFAAEMSEALGEALEADKSMPGSQAASWCDPKRPGGLLGQIFFPTDSFDLDAADQAALDRLAAAVQALPADARARVRLVGVADSRGAEDYNRKLGLNRAAAVQSYLQTRLGPEPRLAIEPPVSLGEQGGPDLAQQRRVDILGEPIAARRPYPAGDSPMSGAEVERIPTRPPSAEGRRLGERVFPPSPEVVSVAKPAKPSETAQRTASAALPPNLPDHLGLRPMPAPLPPDLVVLAAAPRSKEKGKAPTKLYPPDNRTVFSDTSYPFCTVGRVRTPGGVGSGVLVGPRHVLTASHVLPWKPDGGCGWIVFEPAYFDGPSKFGTANSTHVLSYERVTGSIDSDEQRFDYAVVVLDQRLGDTCGWMGSREYTDDWDGKALWAHIGYPGDLNSGERPTFQKDIALDGLFLQSDDHQQIDHQGDIAKGQSGGPFYGWWKGEKGPHVVAVQSSQPMPGDSGDNSASGGGSMVRLIRKALTDHP